MGDYWYKITAIREVNQIIGRCIRHMDDYSSIFLIDERY
jgi:Rad3-related DNA helicase